MRSPYAVAKLSEIVHPRWPSWAPIRHHFGIGAFGVNAWRGTEGDEVIEEHVESARGHEELYVVLSGRATFYLGDETVEAPAGTVVYVADPGIKRRAVAQSPGTTVISIGGWRDRPFEVSEWEAESFDDDDATG